MPQIEPMVHRCVEPISGDRVIIPVTQWDIEHQTDCHVCREPLAPLSEVIAHIYGELTGDPS